MLSSTQVCKRKKLTETVSLHQSSKRLRLEGTYTGMWMSDEWIFNSHPSFTSNHSMDCLQGFEMDKCWMNLYILQRWKPFPNVNQRWAFKQLWNFDMEVVKHIESVCVWESTRNSSKATIVLHAWVLCNADSSASPASCIASLTCMIDSLIKSYFANDFNRTASETTIQCLSTSFWTYLLYSTSNMQAFDLRIVFTKGSSTGCQALVIFLLH